MEQVMVFDTTAKIEWFRLVTLRSAMKMEILYGIKATSRAKGNPFKIAKLEYGIKGRTKVEIYNNFGEFVDNLVA